MSTEITNKSIARIMLKGDVQAKAMRDGVHGRINELVSRFLMAHQHN